MATLLEQIGRTLNVSVRSSGINVVTASEDSVLSVKQAKLQAKLSADDDLEDEWFTDAIPAAEAFVQNAYSFSLLERVVRSWTDAFPPANYLDLPVGPVTEISAISYWDADNVLQPWHVVTTAEKVFLDNSKQVDRAVLLGGESWPTAGLRPATAVQVEYKAGWTDPASVPGDVKHALKMLIAHWYMNREEVVIAPGMTIAEVPFGANSILTMQMRQP